jgi:hypothetical protein
MFEEKMDPSEIFARSVWLQLPDEEDTRWVRRMAEMPRSEQPCGDEGALIKRMLDCGLTEYEIARFAKLACYDAAFSLTYMLGDPGAGIEGMKVDRVEWRLFQTSSAGEAREQMYGMHEFLLQLDPSGRDMRPKAASSPET